MIGSAIGFLSERLFSSLENVGVPIPKTVVSTEESLAFPCTMDHKTRLWGTPSQKLTRRQSETVESIASLSAVCCSNVLVFSEHDAKLVDRAKLLCRQTARRPWLLMFKDCGRGSVLQILFMDHATQMSQVLQQISNPHWTIHEILVRCEQTVNTYGPCMWTTPATAPTPFLTSILGCTTWNSLFEISFGVTLTRRLRVQHHPLMLAKTAQLQCLLPILFHPVRVVYHGVTSSWDPDERVVMVDLGSWRLRIQWMAPELLINTSHAISTIARDVWAFGCVALSLFTNRLPWHGLSHRQILRSLRCGRRPPELDLVTGRFRHLIDRCLQIAPADRCSVAEICRCLYPLHRGATNMPGNIPASPADYPPSITPSEIPPSGTEKKHNPVRTIEDSENKSDDLDAPRILSKVSEFLHLASTTKMDKGFVWDVGYQIHLTCKLHHLTSEWNLACTRQMWQSMTEDTLSPDLALIEWLLKSGADPNLPNPQRNGLTACQFVNRIQIAQLLLQYCGDRAILSRRLRQ